MTFQRLWSRNAQIDYREQPHLEAEHAILHWPTSPKSSAAVCQINQGHGPCIQDFRDSLGIDVIANHPLCANCKFDIDSIIEAAPELRSKIMTIIDEAFCIKFKFNL